MISAFAPRSVHRSQSEQVSIFEDGVSFQGLDSTNDWVKLAKMIPWAELEHRYAQTFTSEVGNGQIRQMAIGALIIKERYGFSDEDTVEEIRMNPISSFSRSASIPT